MTRVRLGSTALLVALIGADCAPNAPSGTVIERLARVPMTDTVPHVWVFFRPSDCLTGATRFDTLNLIARLGQARVHGVMLEPPADKGSARALLERFGAAFPVEFDFDRGWGRAIAREGITPPFYGLVPRRGKAVVMQPIEFRIATLAFAGVVDSGRFSRAIRRSRVTTVERRFFPDSTLRLVRSFDGGAAAFQRPELLAASARRIAVYDFGDSKLKVFDSGGSLLWTIPSTSAPDRVFGSVSDLRVWDDTVAVLDGGARRITVFAPTGAVARSLDLKRAVRRFEVSDGGGFLGFDTSDSLTAGYRFDASGAVTREVQAPPQLRGHPTVITELHIAVSGKYIVAAFRNASVIARYELPAGDVALFEGPETIDFPQLVTWRPNERTVITRIDPKAVKGAVAVGATPTRAYVIFHGATADADRLIDTYDVRQGTYLGTVRLGQRAIGIATTPGGLVTLSPEVAGVRAHVRIWRLRADLPASSREPRAESLR